MIVYTLGGVLVALLMAQETYYQGGTWPAVAIMAVVSFALWPVFLTAIIIHGFTKWRDE